MSASAWWRVLSAIGAAGLLVGCGGGTGVSEQSAQRVAALSDRISQLSAQAARLQDASEIRRLQRAYGYYVEAASWDQVADLFADDGSIEIGLDGVYQGKERVRAYLHALGGGRVGLREGQLNEHLQLQPVVDVAADGRTAFGRWRTLILAGQYHEQALWGEGPYENEYVKDNGVWKIKRLHWYQTFLVPYEGTWAKNRDLNGGIFVSKQLPPDRPPSERYETWPSVYRPPYHYANPVTAAHPPETVATASAARDPDPAIADLQATVDALARRVERLKDVEQIEKLVSVYGYYLDKQQWTDFVGLFSADGTMEISQRGVYVGPASIRRAVELFGPQNIEPEHLHNHIQLQPVIQVSEDGLRAWSRSRALSELGTFQRAGIWGDGVYENEYVKENGIWKIKKDHVYTTFFATTDGGWQSAAGRSPKPSDKIPPDRPATEIYESFPSVYIPPFHYKHPVTGADIVVTQPTQGVHP
jgi:hypothetical protein